MRERIFLKDVGINFKRGDVREFPRDTWQNIEQSAGESLDSFTVDLHEAALEYVRLLNEGKIKGKTSVIKKITHKITKKRTRTRR